MPRGRKPLPAEVKRLRGNPGRRKSPSPIAAMGVPDCPLHLDAAARTEWLRVLAPLVELGIVGQLDRGVLAAYCSAWALYRRAELEVRKHGAVIISPRTKTPYLSPYLAVMTSALRQLRAFAAELGLTPTSRARLAPAGQKPADPLEELRGKG